MVIAVFIFHNSAENTIKNLTNQEESVLVPEEKQAVLQSPASESQKEAALRYLQSADVICSRYRMMHNSIENQYLESQLPEYWNLFKEGIQVINPSYRKHMMWFTDNSICNYLDYFRKAYSKVNIDKQNSIELRLFIL